MIIFFPFLVGGKNFKMYVRGISRNVCLFRNFTNRAKNIALDQNKVLYIFRIHYYIDAYTAGKEREKTQFFKVFSYRIHDLFCLMTLQNVSTYENIVFEF